MNEFTLPFTVECSSQDYLLSKRYEKKSESYLLKIPARTVIGSPITIRLKPTAENLDFQLTIQLEEGAQATIIEDWTMEMRAPYVEMESEILCKANSDLKYVILNGSSPDTSLEIRRTTDISNDAKCHIYAYHFGSKKVDSRLLQKASGPGAEIQTDIVARSRKKQDLSFNTEHLYRDKNGFGEIGMKGIAEDEGHLGFDGMVNIARTGGGSAGYLNQETLNLSENTVVKAVPGLKIDTNDVKAGHGASIRNLNEEDLYYFGARGISKDEAKRLLITGFLGAEIQKISHLEGAYETVKKLI